VPAFALAYDVKVRELAHMLRLEDATVDINQPFTASDIVQPVNALLDDLEDAGVRLRAHAGELATRARADFDDARVWLQERVA
jgi:polysaccharide pyruvyl transferase WcaK-like protein